MGANDFAPYLPNNCSFVVKNIAANRKTIKIFLYPIPYNMTRDLLKIPGVSESDIRASLLKGEILRKIRAQEITIEASDIDLLQFNDAQKLFLQNAGVVTGLEVSSGSGMTSSEHESLRQLIHFIEEGPSTGFSSGAFKEIVGQPFPTSIIWYTNAAKTKKIIEKLIVRNASNNPTIITWNMYDANGITIINTVVDTFTYINNSFETSRVRTIS